MGSVMQMEHINSYRILVSDGGDSRVVGMVGMLVLVVVYIQTYQHT